MKYRASKLTNLLDKDIYIRDNGYTAHVLGTVMVDDKKYIYFITEDTLYIEEIVSINGDNYNLSLFNRIQSDELWDFLFDLGIREGVLK